MSPKGHVLKSCCQLILLVGGGNFNKWELVGKVGHWGCAFEWCTWSPNFLLSLCFLALMIWVAFLYYLQGCHEVLPHHIPWNTRAKWPWTKNSESGEPKSIFPPLSWFSQVFCHSNRRLTNTVVMFFQHYISEQRSGLCAQETWLCGTTGLLIPSWSILPRQHIL
jgi:hypothetical protein